MKVINLISSMLMLVSVTANSCSAKVWKCPICGRENCVCDIDDDGNNKGEEPEKPEPLPTGSEFITLNGGKMLLPDGEEARLYGVNFQTPISWEYNRLARVGIAKTKDALHQVTDNNLNDLQLLGINHLRCHLTPVDFTDSKGNLLESSVFLDALDYLVSEAGKRNIYLSFAFLNHMGNSGPGSEWISGDRATWIQDETVVKCARNYISSLVNHINPYTRKAYKNTTNIAYWELINEPEMYSYSSIRSKSCLSAYNAWLAENGKSDSEASYAGYRSATIRNYIDSMKELLRENGDRHLVCWGLNWHRYRRGNADIFEGVSASEADIVAFCNYPGQDDSGSEYWNKSLNFTSKDFASWFVGQKSDENGYGWALTPAFSKKAVVVYEFETFFNQSAYMYPLQATFFRSLRVQSASMWTYTFSEIAQNMGGSHFLNLRCTPGKMMSFLIAKEIFQSLPYIQDLPSNLNEQKGEHYVISKSHNGAIYSDADKYYNSCEVDESWNPIECSLNVKHIAGYRNSPIVKYSGSGAYFINERDGGLEIILLPDVKVVGDIYAGATYGKIKTELDSVTKNTLSINLNAWRNRPGTLYKIVGGERKSCGHIGGASDLRLSPGQYVIIPD